MRRQRRPQGRLELSWLRRAFGFTRPYRAQLAGGLAATVIASLLSLALPLLARQLFNEAFAARDPGHPGASLNLILYLMLGLFVLEAVFAFLRSWLLALVGEGVVADMRRALFDHVLSLSPAFFTSRRTGEITSRLTSDVATVQGAVSRTLAHFAGQLVALLGGIVVLFVINPELTMFLLAVVPGVALAAVLFGRFLRGVSTRFQDSVAEANAVAEEALTGIRVVKSFVTERFEAARYGARIMESFRLARRRALGRAVFLPVTGLLVASGIALVLWYGGRQVLAGALQPGDLIAFLILTITIGAAVGTLTGLYSELQEAAGASRRIFELLDERPLLAEAENPQPMPAAGGIAFENVTFAYGDGEPVLKDISLDVQEGTVTALVGPSGAGKSTLALLLARFHDPQEGRVTLGGTDLRDLETDALRREVGIVFQETFLFTGTIRDNIRYGTPGADDREVEAAAAAAHVPEFTDRLPAGLDTAVGDHGLTLSGGQRQRIAIARALLKDPRVLVLDEATSALDSESESLVQAALARLLEGRTAFVIAHRLSTVRNAGRVLVLDEGKIVQDGTHADLLARPGLFRDLHDRQFSNT